MSTRRIFTGRNVVLADGQPRPATLIVDAASGKITDVLPHASARTDFADVGDAGWVDAGDHYILPGIVESVCPPPSLARAEL